MSGLIGVKFFSAPMNSLIFQNSQVNPAAFPFDSLSSLCYEVRKS